MNKENSDFNAENNKKDIDETIEEKNENNTNEEIEKKTKKSTEKKEQKVVEEKKEIVEETIDYKDMAMRIQAEFDNYRKRNNESIRISRSEGIADVIIELFPAMDNLERGLDSIKDEKAKSGMELILKQLNEILTKFDVAEIEALGKEFDPKYCHAVAQEEDSENENKVTEVFIKGYQRKNKVLRPAMVKVAK